MNATRRVGLALGIMALLATAVGCGGEAGVAMAPPKSPGPSAEVSVSAQGSPASTPMQPGYGSSGGRSADMSPPPPAAQGMYPTEAPAPSMDSAAKAQRREAEARPGLGTEWGETRFSRISTVPFVRADAAQPFATSALFYNDEEGARAMASSSGFRRWSGGQFSTASGIVSIGLRDERGGFLSGFIAGGKNYIVGESGKRYMIVVRNNTDSRLEVVLSVDGLDVLDGKAGADTMAGGTGNDIYVVDSEGDVVIELGDAGIDTVRYWGARSAFNLSRDSTGSWTVRDTGGIEGVDTLTGVERLQFANTKVALDLSATASAGKTAEIIWTFNRPGDFDFACLIAGHFQAGMVGKITVSAK